MPEIFTLPFTSGEGTHPLNMLARLLAAVLLGAVVAWIYRRTSNGSEAGSSFPITLTLLAVLIAAVTQVIGDSVARAFSLVGALSIVRFRTVVRDTKDTAFVIFSVVVGMALGAQNYWAAVLGTLVVGSAAFIMAARSGGPKGSGPVYLLTVRAGVGQDLEQLAGGLLAERLGERRLMSVSTVRQGASLESTYEVRLQEGVSAEEMIKSLNRIEGVQDVRLEQRGFER